MACFVDVRKPDLWVNSPVTVHMTLGQGRHIYLRVSICDAHVN